MGFVTYHFLLLNLALTLQILDYSTDILEFNTMPMSLLIRLDFPFSLEERNVEIFQQDPSKLGFDSTLDVEVLKFSKVEGDEL